jgi:catechol 1,2-dioxygenase
MLLFLLSPGSVAERACSPTNTDVEGPYYLPDAPFRTEIAGKREPGKRIIIKGAVFDKDCRTLLKGALIEVWQTDAEGKYHYQDEQYRMRGRLRTDAEGRYSFSSILPGRYTIGTGYRPAHIHVRVSYAGYKPLITQLYFKGDPYLWPNDACGRGCRSDDPLRIIDLKKDPKEKTGPLFGTFDMVLQD